jgi:hypothetical protein
MLNNNKKRLERLVGNQHLRRVFPIRRVLHSLRNLQQQSLPFSKHPRREMLELVVK